MSPLPETPDQSASPPRYAWPKYVLAAVTLFFTVCIVWTFQEVSRLKRAKADAQQEMQTGGSPTNSP